ncbi:DUF7507 domain-containing protein [Cohnella lupini]|uniref:Putative repeat protein (TIGR01451 family)/choice-of-anchor A domain-containing protein n=1 Tax=Cohnella lupini TaxID=1294267 RepID=A0A3D9IC45_9BACL|nr:choice-of-anchor A family protein [Cohnella lupini]RED59338.1 putative repeat protein (TIGR01451 family)/choice-of-anchor A domain-containing protein [Cohnella lupini]
MACANLGVANDYNVFVLGNHTQSFVDAGGRVAVGGNATYRSYGIGSALNVSTTRADLIVGGNMDIIGGTNFAGNSVISPTGTIVNYSMTNNNGVSPQPQIGTPIDFAAAGQYLTCASASWGALLPTGTATVAFGTITLTGTSPTLNIFTINGLNVAGSGTSLASANGINIVTPPGSTVLVNISGTGVGFGSYAIFINGGQSTPSNGAVILWNFFQATTAFNLNLSIKGSVLAPLAVWSAVGFGNIDGTMVAQSFVNTTGTLEAHTIPFIGCLPEVACMPMLTIRKTVNGGVSFTGPTGTPLTYVVQVSNTGGGTLTNVQISDPLLGYNQTVPSLASGQSVDFTINSQVLPGAPGSSYLNTAFVQSNQTPQQSSSVTITIEGFFDVSLIKTADRMSAAPGDTVNYTFTVVNPGQATLENVTLTDATLGINLFFPTFVSGTIATFSYMIPNNAVIGSTLVNTAILNASNLPNPVSAQASVLITETPTVMLTKSADRSTALPGDTIEYIVTVSNDSTVTTVFDLQLTDPFLSLDQLIVQLNPQASIVFTGMYTVPLGTPAGTVITNTAVLQSSLGTQTATVQVTVAPLASIAITKTPRHPTVVPGETVIYDIVVTNTGNVPLTNVVISDAALSFSTTIDMLAIGAQSVSEAFFTVPLGTAAGTKFFNTASVITNQTPPEEATSEIIVSPVFSVSIQKLVAPTTAAPGELVTYTVSVTNTSNAPITNVVISDPTIGLMQTINSLPAHALILFEIPFAIPEDAIAGTDIANIVSVVSDQTPVRTASAQVTVAAVPNLTLIKSVSPEIANPGETVTFTLSVFNAGNIALTNVRVIDPILGVDEMIPTLAIGANVEFIIPFTVPAVPPGTILTNTATAVSDQTPTPVEDSASVTVVAAPSIELTKTVSDNTATPGQTVVFTVSLTNTSAISLTNVILEDEFFGIVDSFPTLQSGETRVFTFEFIVPQDTPAGTVFTNVVTAVSDQTPLVSAQAQVTVLAVPGIAISKIANVTIAFPGERVIYTITVTNTGNTTLNNVIVTDNMPLFDTLIPSLSQGGSTTFIIPFTVSGTAIPGAIIANTATASSSATTPVTAEADVLVTPLPSNSVNVQKLVVPEIALPGETVEYTIIVTNNTLFTIFNIRVTDPTIGIDQTISSLDASESLSLLVPYVIPIGTPGGSQLTNTATASVAGLSVSSSATVTILAQPRLALAKSADVQSALPGSTVNYTLTITNTGNVPLTNIDVTDPQLGFATILPSLAAGASQSFVVPFVVPALPIGTIIANTSTAASDQTPDPIQATAYISVGVAATIAISKTADPVQGSPGEVIVYTIVVTNTSALTLTNVIVSDTILNLIETVPTLPPGTSKSVVLHSVIPPRTPEGTIIVNTATVISDQTLPASAEADVFVTALPALTLRKLQDNVLANPGDTIIYTLKLINTGNTPLTRIVLIDPLINLNEIISVIQPQSTVEITAIYRVPTDAIAGSRIINIATVSSNQTPTQQSITNIEIVPVHSILVTKTAQSSTVDPGSFITFVTEITNTSNARLTNLFIEDPLVLLTENISSLDAGATIRLSTLVPVQFNSSVDSQISNQIFVSSTQTGVTSAESKVTVLARPKLRLTKQFPSLGFPGQRVHVILTVANVGNQTLHLVRLTDSVPPINVFTAKLLQEHSFSLHEFYTIPSDAIIGSTIVNRAEAISEEAGPVKVSKELQVVGLIVEKSASADATELNRSVIFRIKVNNPTKLSAHDVVLTDPLAPGTSLVDGSFTLNGMPEADPNLELGFPLGTLNAGSSVNVAFSIKLDNEQPNDTLVNQAFASSTFITDFELRVTSASNLVRVEVFDNEE